MESKKLPVCSFCRKPESGTRRVLFGPGMANVICEACVTFSEELLREPVPAGQPYGTCSFCGKSSDQVERLVFGPGTNICKSCIAFAREQLESG